MPTTNAKAKGPRTHEFVVTLRAWGIDLEGPNAEQVRREFAVRLMRAVYRAWDTGPAMCGESLKTAVDGKDATPVVVWAGRSPTDGDRWPEVD